MADKTFVIDWGGLHGGRGRYWLPGELSRLRDGTFVPGRAPNAAEVFSNLKLPLIEQGPTQSPTDPAPAHATEFLAWVMRYTRAWLFHFKSDLFRDRRIAWHVNLGCPSRTVENPDLIALYRKLGICAWALSQSPAGTPPDPGTRAVPGAGREPADVGLDGLDIVPEFVAEIAEYVGSSQRSDGLHLLVDVGAGTVDTALFNVYRETPDANDQFPIFASSVEFLGTHFLMRNRESAFEARPTRWHDAGQIPNAKDYARKYEVPVQSVLEADEAFRKCVTHAIAKQLLHTKRARYATAREWKEGLRTFLLGGGSSCQVYRDALRRAGERLKVELVGPLSNPCRVECRKGGLTPEEQVRVGVAAGLARDPRLFGQIVPAHEIEDLPAPGPVPRPDHEELYPK